MSDYLRLWSKCSLLVLLLAALVGCAESGASSASAQAGAGEAESRSVSELGPIRFGLVPSEGGTDIVKRFRPVIAQIERELGRPVEAFSATEYLGIITAMQNKQVDVVYMGPKSYVEASRIAGAVAVAKELNLDGVAGYYAIMLAREDSGIKTLADAKGRSFGYVTPNSTSGYLLPAIGVMEETGLTVEEYFGEISYTGTHGNAAYAVRSGEIEVVANNTLDLRAMKSSGFDDSELVEIWRSAMIPAGVIAVRSDLPESFHEQIRQALIELSADSEAMDEMARGGFISATDEDYDIIRVLEQRKAEMVADHDG